MYKDINVKVKGINERDAFVKLFQIEELKDFCFNLGNETKTIINSIEKKQINYIDLGVIEYEVTTVNPVVKKVSDECNVVYYIQEKRMFGFERTDYSYQNEQSAFSKALSLSLQNGRDYKVEKAYDLNENICCDLNVTKEVVSAKPEPQLNQKVVEIHEYLFYGIAHR